MLPLLAVDVVLLIQYGLGTPVLGTIPSLLVVRGMGLLCAPARGALNARPLGRFRVAWPLVPGSS